MAETIKSGFKRGQGSFWVGLVLITAIPIVLADEIPGYKTANQEPKGTTMELVNFEPEMLRFPFEIKYPESWYVREEYGGVPSLFISREPIRSVADQYQVGVSIYYYIDYFMQNIDPDSIGVRDWETPKQALLKAIREKGGQILSETEMTLAGQSAFLVEWQDEVIQVRSYRIKAGNHLMLLTLEAPLEEFEKYEMIFDQIESSIRFTR